MTIRHRYVFGSGNGSRVRDGNDTAILKCAVLGTDDREAAEAYAIANSIFPATYDTNKRLESYSWEEINEGYLFTGQYSYRRLEVDEYRLSIDSSGGSIRMTTSLATTSYAPPAKTAPDFNSAIDVAEGSPRGIDRVIPASKLTVTYRLSRPADPIAFSAVCAELTGSVNDAELLGHDAGELLFLGATGDFGTEIDPQLQFTWASSKNADLTIGTIADIAKKGHEYLWILYEEEKIGAGDATFVVTKPKAVYIEKIYELKDHSLLGLTL